jgi:L-gulonolactone oxidase
MTYRFDPEAVRRIVHECLRTYGNHPLDRLLREITTAFARAYPGQIEETWDWVFTVDGGGNQQVTILHVSPWEYLTIVSSPVATGGFTGRYLTTIHDFIVAGKLLYYSEGQLEPTAYGPGDDIVLRPDEGHCFAVPDHLCMVEYTRGPIPTMFALPVVNTLFGTLDFRSLWKLVRNASRLMWRSLTRRPAWRNWMGNLSSDGRVRRPKDLAEVRAIVREAAHQGIAVRCYGNSHSWTPLVPTDGILLDMNALDRPLPLRDGDPPSGCVRVEAGMSLGGLSDFALTKNLAIVSPTVATQFTVGGLVATGSHGTGLTSRTFSDQVVGLTIVTHDGSVREMYADDPDLPAARVSLGALGVIYAVTLRCRPARNMRCIDRYVPIEQALDEVIELARTNLGVMLFWWPYTETGWLKIWQETDDPVTYTWLHKLEERVGQFLTEGPLSWIVLRVISRYLPALTPAFMRLVLALSRARTVVKSAADGFHFQYEYPPCMDSSHAIPIERTREGWSVYRDLVREFRQRGVYPLNMVACCRFAKAGDSLLALDYGRDTCIIEAVTYKDTPGSMEFYHAVQDRLIAPEFAARPHWAKLLATPDVMRRQFGDRIARFEAVRARWDPPGRFLNPYLEKVFGRPADVRQAIVFGAPADQPPEHPTAAGGTAASLATKPD